MQDSAGTSSEPGSSLTRGMTTPAADASQIMDTDSVEMDADGEPMEAVLSSGKLHANLVATIAW